MTDAEIIAFLKQYGWLDQDSESDYIEAQDVADAIAAYQKFDVNVDLLVHRMYGRALRVGTGIGPATIEAMKAPRCGREDVGQSQEAQGPGNWRGCHGVGDFHRAIVRVDESGLPSHLRGVFWEQVIPAVVESYRELGLDFVFVTDDIQRNIDFSFVQRSNGWIGLAIVGQNQRCGDTIWCQYLATYRPSNTVREWITLVKHELGHNCGLSHSSGGVMNPSIVSGLPVSWRGDPSYSLLRQKFGGEPYVGDEPEPEPPTPDIESRVADLERQMFDQRMVNAAQQQILQYLLNR